MTNKFKEGDFVFAIVTPDVRLIVRRYVDMIYYCKVESNPGAPERVYFERELMGATEEISKKV